MIINFQDIPIYGIAILCSLFINCIVVLFLGKIQDIDKNVIICSLVYEIIGIVLGGKILNLLQNHQYKGIYYSGFSSYGGLFGGIISIIYFSKRYKIELKKLFNIYIINLPLLYSISKIGCFCAGCCYGIEYSGFGNVVYKYSKIAPLGVKLLPIQLIESIVNFIIFIYVLVNYKNNISNYKNIANTFILCGISKFSLEFFRASWNFSITFTQIISIVFVIFGFLIILKKE